MSKVGRWPAGTLCTYCGADNPTTRDHVPPRGVFPKASGFSLPIAPCCETCRSGQSTDDEYFRTVVLSDHRVAEHPVAKRAFKQVARGMRRPEGRAFARTFIGGMREADVRTPAGLHLGTVETFQVDLDRVTGVASRIVRGLHFHEFREPLPPTARVACFGMGPQPAEFVRVFDRREFAAPRRVGGVFEYTYAPGDGPGQRAWQFTLYDGLTFRGLAPDGGVGGSPEEGSTAEVSAER